MELDDALEDYSFDRITWFSKQKHIELFELPISNNTIVGKNYAIALDFFSDYQNFWESNLLIQKYPHSYYKAKQKCCELAILIGENKCNRWKEYIIEWLRLCYRSNSDSNIKFFFRKYDIDTEDEIKKILFTETNLTLKKSFKDNFFIPYLEQLLDWFLLRYDLITSIKLSHYLSKIRSKKSGFKSFPMYLFLASIFILFFFIELNFNLFFYNNDFQKLTSYFSNEGLQVKALVSIELLASLLLIILVGFVGVDIFFRRNYSIYFKLLIPRLLAGILIGYLPLLFAGEIWNTIEKIDVFSGFIIIISSLLFCFYYLFNEVKNILSDSRIAFTRALRIFLIGILESFSLGIIILDLIAKPFIESLDNKLELHFIYGLFGGHIYPKILLIFFPLALFIGIFVQIIWEDKPITHPL